VNIGAPWLDLDEAEHRVLAMQTKLHQWAVADPGRRFDDLANLVYDPAFLVVAWARVRGNKGARTAGVDGVAPRSIVFGAAELLDRLRDDLKAGRFVPQRVREKTIPKASGKIRSLGIPTTADRVVQASLKLALEYDAELFAGDPLPGEHPVGHSTELGDIEGPRHGEVDKRSSGTGDRKPLQLVPVVVVEGAAVGLHAVDRGEQGGVGDDELRRRAGQVTDLVDPHGGGVGYHPGRGGVAPPAWPSRLQQ